MSHFPPDPPSRCSDSLQVCGFQKSVRYNNTVSLAINGKTCDHSTPIQHGMSSFKLTWSVAIKGTTEPSRHSATNGDLHSINPLHWYVAIQSLSRCRGGPGWFVGLGIVQRRQRNDLLHSRTSILRLTAAASWVMGVVARQLRRFHPNAPTYSKWVKCL